MKQKKWFIISEQNEIISIMFNSFEEAKEAWSKLSGNFVICETIYG